MRALFIPFAFVLLLQEIPQLWTEAQITVLVDGQPVSDAEVTIDGQYQHRCANTSPCAVWLSPLRHELSVFVDEHATRERERDVEISAGLRPTEIKINFHSR